MRYFGFIENKKDRRKLEKLAKIEDNIESIVSSHIKYGFEKNETRKQAISILWDIYSHIEKQLRGLGEIIIHKVDKK